MNYPKINMFLLILVVIIALAILFFVLMNKKSMSRQDDALAEILKQVHGDEPSTRPDTHEKHPAKEKEPAEPSTRDWELIYKTSDKIYFEKPLAKQEKDIMKKFPDLVNDDMELLKIFYPICDKLEKGEPLTKEQAAFYEENRELVDEELAYRKEKAARSSGAAATGANMESEATTSPSGNDLKGAAPPKDVEKRNQLILSFFLDGIPKTVKSIRELILQQTKHDYGKNMHRILGKMEGKFLTPIKAKNITFYALPEWFDGKKLKPEYKEKIAA